MKESLNKSEPSKEILEERIRLAKGKLKFFLPLTVITVGAVVAALALSPMLLAAFPAFAGAIKTLGAVTVVVGSLTAFVSAWVALGATATIATNGRYYPNYDND